MIKSMTGFAHREIAQTGFRASLSIKSYNNRYLDLAVYLPPYLASLEPRLRSFLANRIVHGKVEASLRVRELDMPVTASADIAAAKAVSEVFAQIVEACGLEGGIGLDSLIGFEGVVTFDRRVDEEAVWARVLPELEACFDDYEAARLREGATTRVDIVDQLARVSRALALTRDQVPEIERTVREQLKSRFAEAMGDAVDEGRVLSEIASALMKYTINEELSRLAAHVASFSNIMDKEASPGKKLDFLCQEMNREVNTIGSKSMLLLVSQTVVEFKDALENVREQLRNVE
jgi:uncharacterized protein (TIGR00255 family)